MVCAGVLWPRMEQTALRSDSPGSGFAESHGFKAQVGAGPESRAEMVGLSGMCTQVRTQRCMCRHTPAL